MEPMDRLASGHGGTEGIPCPLCGVQMLPRKRDPLARVTGFLVLYASASLFLLLCRDIDGWSAAALGVLCLWALLLMRSKMTVWCPSCWHEMLPRDASPGGRREEERPQESGS